MKPVASLLFRPGSGTASARGLALVAVLWMVAALSLLVASLLAVSRAGTAAATTHAALVRATALGDAGIQLAVLERQQQPEPDRAAAFVGHYQFDGLQIEVELLPANAYIDLNRASLELLTDLLVHGGGVDTASARQLAERIIDWRDPDDQAQGGGSELLPYETAGLSVRPRNGEFQSKEDLLQVAGINLDLFARIEPLLTVWSGRAEVNPLSAPAAVLEVLAAGDRAQVGAFLQQRARDGRVADTSRLATARPDGDGGSGVLHALARVEMADGARIVRGRWLELRQSADGSPWQTLASEAARFETDN